MKKFTYLLVIMFLSINVFAQYGSIEEIEASFNDDETTIDIIKRNTTNVSWRAVGIFNLNYSIYYYVDGMTGSEVIQKIEVISNISAMSWTEKYYFDEFENLIFYTYFDHSQNAGASYKIENKDLKKIIGKDVISDNHYITYEENVGYSDIYVGAIDALQSANANFGKKAIQQTINETDDVVSLIKSSLSNFKEFKDYEGDNTYINYSNKDGNTRKLVCEYKKNNKDVNVELYYDYNSYVIYALYQCEAREYYFYYNNGQSIIIDFDGNYYSVEDFYEIEESIFDEIEELKNH